MNEAFMREHFDVQSLLSTLTRCSSFENITGTETLLPFTSLYGEDTTTLRCVAATTSLLIAEDTCGRAYLSAPQTICGNADVVGRLNDLLLDTRDSGGVVCFFARGRGETGLADAAKQITDNPLFQIAAVFAKGAVVHECCGTAVATDSACEWSHKIWNAHNYIVYHTAEPRDPLKAEVSVLLSLTDNTAQSTG
jgi:hypothetical protein